MLLLRTNSGMGTAESCGTFAQSSGGRQSVWLPGGSAEPVIHAEQIINAIPPAQIETFRPLLPVGYEATLAAYRQAMDQTTVANLTRHYQDGLEEFHEVFVPHLKRVLEQLSGGAWNFSDHVAYAAGSDVVLWRTSLTRSRTTALQRFIREIGMASAQERAGRITCASQRMPGTRSPAYVFRQSVTVISHNKCWIFSNRLTPVCST